MKLKLIYITPVPSVLGLVLAVVLAAVGVRYPGPVGQYGVRSLAPVLHVYAYVYAYEKVALVRVAAVVEISAGIVRKGLRQLPGMQRAHMAVADRSKQIKRKKKQ